uniref:Thymus-specific serine protease n=1 Tax=Anas zonorhyncha TaxID=75864 RepID=A0A8B9VWW9_9AVES
PCTPCTPLHPVHPLHPLHPPAPHCTPLPRSARCHRGALIPPQAFLRRGGQPCTPSSRRALLRELRGLGSAGGSRAWLFQTCTEFGFYPSCEDAACPFSRFQTLRAQLSLCSAAFGIAPVRVREAAANTNGFYGAARIQAPRLLFVNGALDPWHVLSAGGGRRGVLIAGASHCVDMAPPRPGDPPALTAARQVSGDRGGTREGAQDTWGG